MKHAILLLFAFALTASAQMPFITGMMAQSPAAAGGGESPTGVSGAPVFYAVATNGVAAQNMDVTANAGPASTPNILICALDWYPSTRTLSAPTFNGSASKTILLTNLTWFSGGGVSYIYAITNVSGTATCRAPLNGAPDEATWTVETFTNCSLANFITSIGQYGQNVTEWSLMLASTTKDIGVGHFVIGVSPATPAMGINMVSTHTPFFTGTDTHTASDAYIAGGTTVSNWWNYASGGDGGVALLSLKGIP